MFTSDRGAVLVIIDDMTGSWPWQLLLRCLSKTKVWLEKDGVGDLVTASLGGGVVELIGLVGLVRGWSVGIVGLVRGLVGGQT
jgi:hypothetical protein